MNKQIGIKIVLGIIFTFLQNGNLEAQYKIKQSVFFNGAGNLTSENRKIKNIIGQTVMGTSKNNNYILKIGFEYEEQWILTDLTDHINYLPNEFELFQNYPNPFNPTSTIIYTIVEMGNVNITIYDVLGRKVKELVNEIKTPGSYDVEFSGSNFASGVYFYTMKVNNFLESKKMILAK